MIRISKSYIRCHIFCARVCIFFLNIHRTPSTMRARVSPTSSLIFSHTYFLECARLFSHFLESENMFISSNLRKNIRENMEQKMGETRAHMLESVLLIFSRNSSSVFVVLQLDMYVCLYIFIYIYKYMDINIWRWSRFFNSAFPHIGLHPYVFLHAYIFLQP